MFTLSKGAEQEAAEFPDREENNEYYDLQDKLGQIKKKVEFTQTVYFEELNGVAKRRDSMKSKFTYSLLFLGISLLADAFLWLLMKFGDGYIYQMGQLCMMFLVVLTICLGVHAVRAYMLYQKNTLSAQMNEQLKKRDVHTLVEEEAYCREVLRQMTEYEALLSEISKESAREDFEPEAAYKKLDQIKEALDNIKDFRYNAGRTNK